MDISEALINRKGRLSAFSILANPLVGEIMFRSNKNSCSGISNGERLERLIKEYVRKIVDGKRIFSISFCNGVLGHGMILSFLENQNIVELDADFFMPRPINWPLDLLTVPLLKVIMISCTVQWAQEFIWSKGTKKQVKPKI